jgi:hypothetical protein
MEGKIEDYVYSLQTINSRIDALPGWRPYFDYEIEKLDLLNAIDYFEIHCRVAHQKLWANHIKEKEYNGMTRKIQKKHNEKIDNIYIEFAVASLFTYKNAQTKDCSFNGLYQTDAQFLNLFNMLVGMVKIENPPKHIGIYIKKAKKHISYMVGAS